MDDFGGGLINSLTRCYDNITKGNLMVDSPEYIWDSEMAQSKRVNLLTDWIKVENPDDYVKIIEIWYNEIGEESNFKQSKEKIITMFTDKRDLAKQFLNVQPLFYNTSKMWWMWNKKESKWFIVDDVDILNLVNHNSHANTIRPHERNEIIEGLKQEGRRLNPIEGEKTWVQFKDNIIDINTNKKFKATSKYFVTNPIPFSLGDSEDTPVMDKLFEEWVGKDYIKTLYEILAYCCLPDYPIHRIFCFIGAGCNGKSQFLSLLRKFIGSDNCCSTELDTLLHSRFEKTRLYKKLVCQMGETNFNEMSQTSLLKKLCGGDLIGFEYKNKDPFDAENYAKIIIATNTLPSTTDKTLGFYRRWLIIDFPNRFKETNGDIINKIPLIEYNNLAKKCVKILKELLKQYKFHKEGSIEDRAKKYEDKSNPFEKFWTEKIEEDFDSHIFKFDFKDEFNSWCKSNGLRKMSEKEIKHKMDEKNIETVRRDWFGKNDGEFTKRYMAWDGIKFIDFVKGVKGVKGVSLSSSPMVANSDRVDRVDRVDTGTTKVLKSLPVCQGSTLANIPNTILLYNISKEKEKKELEKSGHPGQDILDLIPENKEIDLQQLCIGSKFSYGINEENFNKNLEDLKKQGLVVETKPGKILKL